MHDSDLLISVSDMQQMQARNRELVAALAEAAFEVYALLEALPVPAEVHDAAFQVYKLAQLLAEIGSTTEDGAAALEETLTELRELRGLLAAVGERKETPIEDQ
jgi:hypothetical protein